MTLLGLPNEIILSITKNLVFADWKNLSIICQRFNDLLRPDREKHRKKYLEEFPNIEASYFSLQNRPIPLAKGHHKVALGIGDAALPCYGCLKVLPLKMFSADMQTYRSWKDEMLAKIGYRSEYQTIEDYHNQPATKSMFVDSWKTDSRFCLECALRFNIQLAEGPDYFCKYRDPEIAFWGFRKEHAKETRWHEYKFLNSVYKNVCRKGGCYCLLGEELKAVKSELSELNQRLKIIQGQCWSSREVESLKAQKKLRTLRYATLKGQERKLETTTDDPTNKRAYEN